MSPCHSWSTLHGQMIDCINRPRKGAHHPAVCYPHAWCLPSLSPDWSQRLGLGLETWPMRLAMWLDLGLQALWLVTCTRAGFIHRLKIRPSMNALISNSEHLLLIMHSAKYTNSSAAVECLLSHDHNAHDWPTKYWAICLLEWIANFHWFSLCWCAVKKLLTHSLIHLDIYRQHCAQRKSAGI